MQVQYILQQICHKLYIWKGYNLLELVVVLFWTAWYWKMFRMFFLPLLQCTSKLNIIFKGKSEIGWVGCIWLHLILQVCLVKGESLISGQWPNKNVNTLTIQTSKYKKSINADFLSEPQGHRLWWKCSREAMKKSENAKTLDARSTWSWINTSITALTLTILHYSLKWQDSRSRNVISVVLDYITTHTGFYFGHLMS